MVEPDNIIFNTLFFRPYAALDTNARVFTSIGDKPYSTLPLLPFYQVHNLDAITHATWSTQGTFAPVTDPQFDYMRFDLANILPNDLIVDFSGNGTVSLLEFDPMAQHEKYLTKSKRPRYSDDPAYRDYEDTFDSDADVSPAFLTSVYQTKRLSLGDVTLINKTNGNVLGSAVWTDALDNEHYISNDSALGDLYNDFAFTAGLRRYYFDVYVDSQATDNPLKARNYYTADASKVYAQAAVSGVISANQTFENTLSALDAAFGGATVDKTTVTALLGWNSIKVDTGSYAKVRNFSGAISVARKIEHEIGESAIGLFAEYGDGNYDTYTFVPRYGEVFGEGDVKTFGGGIFIKTLFSSNTFISASFRGGGIQNEYSLTQDPWILHPEVHSADTQSSYIGAHLEVGQKFQVYDGGELEGYGKFLWTHSPQDTFTTRFGDNISIDSFDSARLRIGARLISNLREDTVQLYFGLAGEHEFDGDVSGKLNEDRFTHKVDTSGTSGFGELGINITPNEYVTISIGAFGWAGNARGGGGSASVNFSF
jgi:hypothetical protein